MKTEQEMQNELKSILRSIGETVRHAWEMYGATGAHKYLSLLTDLDEAKNAIAKNIDKE